MKFEKVPKTQYIADGGKNYDDVILPARATSGSAGYDFFLPIDLDLKIGQKVTVPTGIRCKLDENAFLAIFPKSGLGVRYGLNLANTVGIVDSDYYGAKNYGHILITLVNNGDAPINLSKGKAFVQGIIMPYLKTGDDDVSAKRTGGHGSTEK
ncbi:MAG TPA: deoxyuridine 5'-triphosphate nucleotidohydrolase [Eubacteriales bacterium]|nr:deoxyuridine 5'-triphosphate nucleotidohydrolase [Eubacteriales bacterium]